jgi:PIN domain nuclease of toxin-antitoxin system
VRVLVDTQIVLRLLRGTLPKQHPPIMKHLAAPTTVGFVSVASLWEMAIKTRLGKLEPGMALDDIAGYLEAIGLALLPITAPHVTTATVPLPQTKDPFDRLLLAQCQVENLVLVTLDGALLDHPLAWNG